MENHKKETKYAEKTPNINVINKTEIKINRDYLYNQNKNVFFNIVK